MNVNTLNPRETVEQRMGRRLSELRPDASGLSLPGKAETSWPTERTQTDKAEPGVSEHGYSDGRSLGNRACSEKAYVKFSRQFLESPWYWRLWVLSKWAAACSRNEESHGRHEARRKEAIMQSAKGAERKSSGSKQRKGRGCR